MRNSNDFLNVQNSFSRSGAPESPEQEEEASNVLQNLNGTTTEVLV